MVMVAMPIPRRREGKLSGSRTFQMIWRLVAPMARALSITPLSSSLKELSTIRAINGAALMTRGKMTPRVPEAVPITSRV